MGVNGFIFFSIFYCLISSIRCALSSTDASVLDKRIVMIRDGMEKKLAAALVDIDKLKDNMGTCKCPDWNTTITDGGWSSWSVWGSCSVSCGSGIKSRTRSCTNPAPSTLGKDCIGNNKDMTSCSNVRCPEIVSAFSVTEPLSRLASYNNRLTFSRTIYNHGGDFNAATGVFTCSKPGVYQFSVFLVKKRSTTRVDRVDCYLYKDSSSVMNISVDPTDDDTDKGNAQAANSVVFHMSRGQSVYLGDCSDPTERMDPWSSFSGVLINPDV